MSVYPTTYAPGYSTRTFSTQAHPSAMQHLSSMAAVELSEQQIEVSINGQNVEMEWSVHVCSKALWRDLFKIFPSCPASEAEQVLLIPTIQHTRLDLIESSPEVEKEKDERLEIFVQFARRLKEALEAQGSFWTDCIDPCSGYAFFSERGPSGYNEVEGFETFCKMPSIQTGICKVLSHFQWKTYIYPATVFTTAPLHVVEKAIASMKV